MERLPVVRRLLALRQTHGDDRLEAACTRALRFDDPSYGTIKRILEQGLEDASAPAPVAATLGSRFARSASELLGSLFQGGATWN